MVFGGDCIAKIDGKTVFVEGGILPGEKAEVETVVSKKDYDRALVKKILAPDAARRESRRGFSYRLRAGRKYVLKRERVSDSYILRG